MSSSNRRPYLTATVLDQSLLDFCHDNLETRLEMVVEIETPDGTIYASDRNKYVGGTFYEALLNFPVIGRTVGEWLSNTLQFSTLTLELSNVDGRFNKYLPAGASYGSWTGKRVEVKLGLAEQAGTYKTIFRGSVTDVGGFKRSTRSVTVIARDDYDAINQDFPTGVFTEAEFPKIESKNIGKVVPVIYGDWTTATEPSPAAIPALCVNGNDPRVTMKDKPVASVAAPASPCVFTVIDHDFTANDPVKLTTSGTLPSPFSTLTTYYIKTILGQDTFTLSSSPGGSDLNATTSGSGDHRIIIAAGSSTRNVQLVQSSVDLTYFDTGNVFVKRGDVYYAVPVGSIANIGTGSKSFEIIQGGTWFGGAAYAFDQGDTFWTKVKGKDLGAYDDNLVSQARDILITYGGVLAGSLHSNWDTYRDKASPSQSAITLIKSRAWIGEKQSALTYALSMLEQVRLEAFIDRDLKVKINSLHFEDWPSSPSYTVKNWDIVRGTFKTSTDERNNFNAAQGNFNFLPDLNQNAYLTPVFRNQAAVTQTGKRIAKRVVFPNLYNLDDAVAQTQEIIRLASSGFETISVSTTWRSILKDIGDFVKTDIEIGSTIFDGVPAMIRDVGYDPVGLTVVLKLWSMSLVPFPGYVPGYAGTVGGYSATISEES
jgi:hypothetical protein